MCAQAAHRSRMTKLMFNDNLDSASPKQLCQEIGICLNINWGASGEWCTQCLACESWVMLLMHVFWDQTTETGADSAATRVG